MVSILGIPLDENSSYLRGAALAPAQMRAALHSGAMNLCVENGIDLSTREGWHDIGDVALSSGNDAFREIEAAVREQLARGERMLSLGGDHSITYPILRAYAAVYQGLTILHLDAHPDLYDEFEGNRRSHACPFARIMEEGLATRLVQVGIRTMNPHQREQAQRFGVKVIAMRDWRAGMPLPIEGPLYLSLDLDALDPAFAPGVSHHEPGGFSTREVLTILEQIKTPLVGADIVEFNPTRDPLGVTAALGAKLYKEFVAKLLQ